MFNGSDCNGVVGYTAPEGCMTELSERLRTHRFWPTTEVAATRREAPYCYGVADQGTAYSLPTSVKLS